MHVCAHVRPGSPSVIDRSFKDKEKLKRVMADKRAYKGKPRLQTGVQMLALTQVREAWVSLQVVSAPLPPLPPLPPLAWLP